MKIPVLGCDPSLRNWGLASATLDLDTGMLSDIFLDIAETTKTTNKQLRVNSDDINRCHLLASKVIPLAQKAKYVFIEVPVGSQNADSMKSYGVCCGIIGVMQYLGISVVQVIPSDVKLTFTGKATATKSEMISTAVSLYPNTNWPINKNNKSVKLCAEHMADAIASIHAGVKSQEFQSYLLAYKHHANHSKQS